MVSVVFQIFLRMGSSDDERQINRWKRVVASFKSKIINMIKDDRDKFDDYSVSSKIREVFAINWK